MSENLSPEIEKYKLSSETYLYDKMYWRCQKIVIFENGVEIVSENIVDFFKNFKEITFSDGNESVIFIKKNEK
jgi:hypothetical protein